MERHACSPGGSWPPATALPSRATGFGSLSSGSRTVVSTAVFVAGSNCRYGTRVIVPRSVSGTVHVRARFLGNSLLTPHSAKTQNVRVG